MINFYFVFNVQYQYHQKLYYAHLKNYVFSEQREIQHQSLPLLSLELSANDL